MTPPLPIFLRKMVTLSGHSASYRHQFLCPLDSDVLRNDVNLCFPGCQGLVILFVPIIQLSMSCFQTNAVHFLLLPVLPECMSVLYLLCINAEKPEVCDFGKSKQMQREHRMYSSVKCMSISKQIYFPTLIFQLRSICFLSGSQLPSGLSLASHHSDDYCNQ